MPVSIESKMKEVLLEVKNLVKNFGKTRIPNIMGITVHGSRAELLSKLIEHVTSGSRAEKLGPTLKRLNELREGADHVFNHDLIEFNPEMEELAKRTDLETMNKINNLNKKIDDVKEKIGEREPLKWKVPSHDAVEFADLPPELLKKFAQDTDPELRKKATNALKKRKY